MTGKWEADREFCKGNFSKLSTEADFEQYRSSKTYIRDLGETRTQLRGTLLKNICRYTTETTCSVGVVFGNDSEWNHIYIYVNVLIC